LVDEVLLDQVGLLFLGVVASAEVAQLRIYVVLVVVVVLGTDFSATSSCANS